MLLLGQVVKLSGDFVCILHHMLAAYMFTMAVQVQYRFADARPTMLKQSTSLCPFHVQYIVHAVVIVSTTSV